MSADQRPKLRHHLVCCSLFLKLPAAASVRWRALPTRCPSKEPDPVLKDASHAQTSLGPKQSILLFINLSRDSSFSTILMNPSCSCTSQSGNSYLARDQSHAIAFAGASYVHWLIDHFFLSIFFYISCLVTNKDIHLPAFLTLFLFNKGMQQDVALYEPQNWSYAQKKEAKTSMKCIP